MMFRQILGIFCFTFSVAAAATSGSGPVDPWLSQGRTADPTAKTLSEIRAAEKRRIPLEVQLKTSNRYPQNGPVEVTVIITNLFDAPLVLNNRMLVNHPLLQGEISFRIVDKNGKKVDIQRLITPLSLRDQDFVTVKRGESMQRAVDLTDLYGIADKGVYKVRVCYHNEVDHVGSLQHAWKGVVWSEPVEITLD